MQKNDYVSNPLKNSTTSLENKIRRDYVQPFIESLKLSKLDETEIIQETFRYLQLTSANIYQHKFTSIDNNKKELEFLYDFDNAIMNDSFKQRLLTCSDLKIKFIQLGFLYLDEAKQKQYFPECSKAEIQTCIRELFHDYLNPLSQMRIKDLSTISIPINGNQIKNNADIFKLPVDIQKNIYSYLNHESIFSFKKACKSAYFLHKGIQDKQANIFYLVADGVKITRPRRFYEFDDIMPLRSSVSDEEIVSSLSNNTNSEEVKIFNSLYHALEYSQYLQQSVQRNDNDDVFMPSVWAVVYIGNPAKLKFTQENIVINEGCSSSAFDGDRRDTSISYAVTTKNTLQPLLGTVVCTNSDFASYTTFNFIDFKKYMQSGNDESFQDKCIDMAFYLN